MLAKQTLFFFTRKRCQSSLPQRSLHLNGTDIKWLDSIKYLGIHLDPKLTFQQHINCTLDKISKTIRILYPFINRRSELSLDNKILLVKQIFIPILTFGSPVWGDCAKSHISKLQIAQNKILKLVLNLPFDFSTKKLHEQANVNLIFENINIYRIKFLDKLHCSDNKLINSMC